MTVASHRMILENPHAPGTGIIVAAGDEIPPQAVGYIENTPNKVDAARNADVADAADQAKNARPAERVVQRFGDDGEAAAIRERTAENRREYDDRMRAQNDPQGWLTAADFHGGVRATSEHEAGPTTADQADGDRGETADGKALEHLTVKQLDQLADGLGDGKPDDYGGSKAEKVSSLQGKVTQRDIDGLEA